MGIHDMSCNIWKWVQDMYDSDAYPRSSRKDNPVVDSGGSSRVLRGWAWSNIFGFALSVFCKLATFLCSTLPSL
ncbi:SUMF1/EgtB/PvdO family nonheme iron enzyme [Desulfonatronovibrio magnus]|uniref:SUMF1/EgtB/PvdO family nonheme iron enzyme n=1 Tax=Desulfonatronovibrio magnus TaxID=698827 RepID=UPI00338F0920